MDRRKCRFVAVAAMVYATELIQRYRQALIYLWNMHFWAPSEFRDWSSVNQFNRVKLPLFTGLVLNRLSSEVEDPVEVSGEEYKIVPNLTRAGSSIATFMVDRKRFAAGVFEELKGPFKADDLKLSVVDFFDFQSLTWRELRYFSAKVEHFPSDPSIVGCEALVEVFDVDVIWQPAKVLGLPTQFPLDEGT